MMYNDFSIVDYQKSEDENKAIQKLAEHRMPAENITTMTEKVMRKMVTSGIS